MHAGADAAKVFFRKHVGMLMMKSRGIGRVSRWGCFKTRDDFEKKMKSSIDPPPGWDRNKITKSFDQARSNQYATFHNLKDWVGRLSDIDKAYRKVIDGLNNTPEWFSGFFLPRSHSSFLAACNLCWAGQTTEVYPVLRLCLENALYPS